VVVVGVGLVAGLARGRVHLAESPLDWTGTHPGADQVLAVPAVWWPPPDGVPDAPVAFLLHGVPSPSPAVTLVPVVADIDRDLLLEGEDVVVDGDHGTLRLPAVTDVPVVTAFLERPDGKVLLLQRSSRVGSFQGRWAGVSGFLEDPTPLAQAVREVGEETGLEPTELELARAGRSIYARDGGRLYVVHPFRFRVLRSDVRLDWEHTTAEWVEPSEIRTRPTVPKLDRAWEAVRPLPPPKE
jgi:ADP-ribose pyrophosphatase YjhB (NUDIX family)